MAIGALSDAAAAELRGKRADAERPSALLRPPGDAYHSAAKTRERRTSRSETTSMKKLLLTDLTAKNAWRMVAVQIGLIALLGALS
jgi:hypothetical protein